MAAQGRISRIRGFFSKIGGKVKGMFGGMRKTTWRTVSSHIKRNKRAYAIGGGVLAVGGIAAWAMNSSPDDESEGAADVGTNAYSVKRRRSDHAAALRQLSALARDIVSEASFNEGSLTLNKRYIQLALVVSDVIDTIPNDEFEIEARNTLSLFLKIGRLGLTVDAVPSDAVMLHHFSTVGFRSDDINSVQESLMAVLELSGDQHNNGVVLRSSGFNRS
jgi:hypothetical protein